MKKIMLIVGMILCVAVIGSVFAVAVYDAQQATATVTADTYIELGWDGTADTNLVLEPGITQIYTVNLTVDKSASVTDTSTFRVVCANTSETVTLGQVSVVVCEDNLGVDAVDGDSDNVTVSGNNTTITGITQNTTYYIAVTLAANATEEQVTNCGGTMTLSFNVAE